MRPIAVGGTSSEPGPDNVEGDALAGVNPGVADKPVRHRTHVLSTSLTFLYLHTTSSRIQNPWKYIEDRFLWKGGGPKAKMTENWKKDFAEPRRMGVRGQSAIHPRVISANVRGKSRWREDQ